MTEEALTYGVEAGHLVLGGSLIVAVEQDISQYLILIDITAT